MTTKKESHFKKKNDISSFPCTSNPSFMFASNSEFTLANNMTGMLSCTSSF